MTSNDQNTLDPQTTLKRKDDSESHSPKKLKVDDSNKEFSKIEEAKDWFFQLEEYYSEALENLDLDSEKTSDLIKIIINQSDRLLRELYEEVPSLFDFKFYLVFGCSLLLYDQLILKEEDEEERKECLNLVIDRLQTSLDLALKSEDAGSALFEVKLALAKAYCQKSCKDMQVADLTGEGELWYQASSWLDKASNLLDETLIFCLESNTSKKGLFVSLDEEVIGSIEFIQLLADRQQFWPLCKQWNNWALDKFKSFEKFSVSAPELYFRACLGIGSSQISQTNFYFDNAPQDDASEDEDEEEHIISLCSDINSEKAKSLLLDAVSNINIAIEGMKKLSPENNDFLARSFVLLGEAYLNIGNINDSDDSQENLYYKNAVQAFQTSKLYNPDDLLPEAFQAFLEEFSLQIEN